MNLVPKKALVRNVFAYLSQDTQPTYFSMDWLESGLLATWNQIIAKC